MEIWLKQNKIALRLPILPSGFQNDGEQSNQTETVNKTGEVNLLGLPKLDTISLSSHFPAKKMYYDQYSGYPKPKKCVELVEKMKKGGVIKLIITPYINRQATIEKFTWGLQDGTGDIYFTMETKEYKKPKISGINTRPAKEVKKRMVMAKKGDTWAKLAKKYTGNSKNARKIQKANRMTNLKNPPLGKKVLISV